MLISGDTSLQDVRHARIPAWGGRLREAAIRKALAGIERDGHVDAKPQMIRIEKL